MRFALFSGLFFLLVFSACREKPATYLHLQGNAQGTTFSIIYGDSLNRDFSQQVDSLFRLIDKSMSLWDTSSIITRINSNDLNAVPDAHFIKVLNASASIYQLSNGFFDVTVGPLVRTWGFSYKKNLPLPDSAQVDSLLQLVGMNKVRLENGKIIKQVPAMELDFNAIAQGYTVDLMADYLMEHGIHNYMIEIGGEVRTSGHNESGTDWRIGIDKPIAEGERALQTVCLLKNKALATSGSYRKFVTRDGHKYSHAIDPHTGYPVEHRMLSVSVLADDCTSADGWATACLVAGMEKSLEWAASNHFEVYCIYYDLSDKSLKTQYSIGFEAILQQEQ